MAEVGRSAGAHAVIATPGIELTPGRIPFPQCRFAHCATVGMSLPTPRIDAGGFEVKRAQRDPCNIPLGGWPGADA